tara:strand:- start:118 stop:453 length:336 start_codon:yes stop_codon:yes gene_type:complete
MTAVPPPIGTCSLFSFSRRLIVHASRRVTGSTGTGEKSDCLRVSKIREILENKSRAASAVTFFEVCDCPEVKKIQPSSSRFHACLPVLKVAGHNEPRLATTAGVAFFTQPT